MEKLEMCMYVALIVHRGMEMAQAVIYVTAEREKTNVRPIFGQC